MSLLDSHAHLWSDDIAGADWLAGERTRVLQRAFGIDELSAAAARGTRFVCVIAESTTAETVRMLQVAEASPAIVAVVGWVDPAVERCGRAAKRLRSGRGGEYLAGVRLPLVVRGPRWFADPRVTAGIREIAGQGLVIELLVNADQLRTVATVCETLPDVTFVLDHLGGPTDGAAQWRTDTISIAEVSNVVAKLSGAAIDAMSADAANAAVLEAFGPDRVLFGSDWPISTLGHSYPETVDRARQVIDSLGWDPAGVFTTNAARVYGIAA